MSLRQVFQSLWSCSVFFFGYNIMIIKYLITNVEEHISMVNIFSRPMKINDQIHAIYKFTVFVDISKPFLQRIGEVYIFLSKFRLTPYSFQVHILREHLPSVVGTNVVEQKNCTDELDPRNRIGSGL